MNTRFAVAVHILTLLESQGGASATSEFIASSVGTNPSLIRRLLSPLTRAGLVAAQRGAGGGVVLNKPADTLTLLDVYLAIDDEADVLPVHETASPKCPVGRHIQVALAARIDAAEQAMKGQLAATTIADLTRDVVGREQRLAAAAR